MTDPESPSPLHKADIVFEDGVPVSQRHNDPYYSRDDGLAESQFTFLDGNDLDYRWRDCEQFTIGETGFGTGLNFLAVLDRLVKAPSGPRRLRYISVEAFPLKSTQLKEAHAAFPALATLSETLLACLPPPEPGIHTCRLLDGRVELILLHGEAGDMLTRITAKIDAWFLDAFAPSRNADMWRADVLTAIARASAPKATFATFTAAGFVRRGLMAAGFDVQKRPGFGRKRERLVGHLAKVSGPATVQTARPAGRIGIIGAGLAGLTLARALKREGAHPILFEDPTTKPASQVPIALIAPRFHLGRQQPQARFIAQAYASAAVYPPYHQAAIQPLGTVMLPGGTADLNRLHRMHDAFDWGDDWIARRPDGIFLPRSSALDTKALLHDLRANLDIRAAKVTAINKVGKAWRIKGIDQEIDLDTVIIATGAGETIAGLPTCDIRRVPGHVAQFEADQITRMNNIAEALVGDKYLSPTDAQGRVTLGATIEKNTALSDPTQELLDGAGSILSAAGDAKTKALWRGVRATIADHMPMVGALMPENLEPLARVWLQHPDPDEAQTHLDKLADGLFGFFGFGSKGFQYCPLAADMLARRILGTAATLPDDMYLALEPCRFEARSIKRGQS